MEITTNLVTDYIEEIDEPRKADIQTLLAFFTRITKKEPQMWGSIIGFGNLHYKYKSGTEGNMPLIGFSNRKQAITLYLSFTISKYPELEKLGKAKTSKSCLYINKLSDIDLNVLETITRKAMVEALSYDFDHEV